MIITSHLYAHGQLLYKFISFHFRGQTMTLTDITMPPKIAFPFDIYASVWRVVVCYAVVSVAYFIGTYMYFALDLFFITSLSYCRIIFLLINRRIQVLFEKYDSTGDNDKALADIVELHNKAFQLVDDLEKVANYVVLIMLIMQSFAVCLIGFAMVSCNLKSPDDKN
jgi:hypothetical protein